jgi:ketosteroid isomerase-like protein
MPMPSVRPIFKMPIFFHQPPGTSVESVHGALVQGMRLQGHTEGQDFIIEWLKSKWVGTWPSGSLFSESIDNQRESQMTTIGSAIGIAAVLLLSTVTPASTQQDEPSAGGELFEKMQSEFAEAYNRRDVPAMAAFFSENSVRITPAGVFRGREAIGRELQRVVIVLGLHDYSVQRSVSRLEGGMVFNAGEWRATLGDGKQYHGYYSALLIREGDAVKIFEETTNVAAP